MEKKRNKWKTAGAKTIQRAREKCEQEGGTGLYLAGVELHSVAAEIYIFSGLFTDQVLASNKWEDF